MTEYNVIEIGTFNRHESCPVRTCNYIFEGYDYIEDMFLMKKMYLVAWRYFYEYKYASPIHFKFYPSGLTQATVAVLDAFTQLTHLYTRTSSNVSFDSHKLSIHIWDREAEKYREQTWGYQE